MDLYWFIPALVKSRVGSDKGATGEEGTRTSNALSVKRRGRVMDFLFEGKEGWRGL
jgi:hypothetical protein